MFAPTSQKFKGVIAPLRVRRFCGSLNANFSNRVLGKYGVFRPLWQGAMLIHRRGYNGAKDEFIVIQQAIHRLHQQSLLDLHPRFMLTFHFHHPASAGITNREHSLVCEPYFFQYRLLQPLNTRVAQQAVLSGPRRELAWRDAGHDKIFNFFATGAGLHEFAALGHKPHAPLAAPEIKIFLQKLNGGLWTRESHYWTNRSLALAPRNGFVSANARPDFFLAKNLRLVNYALKPESTTSSSWRTQIYASYPATLVYSLTKLQTEKAVHILNHFLPAMQNGEGEPVGGHDRVRLTNAVRLAPDFSSPYAFPPEMELAKPPQMNALTAVKNSLPAPAPPAPLPRPNVSLQDLDIQKLTNRVYDEFERKLRSEKERRGL